VDRTKAPSPSAAHDQPLVLELAQSPFDGAHRDSIGRNELLVLGQLVAWPQLAGVDQLTDGGGDLLITGAAVVLFAGEQQPHQQRSRDELVS